MALPASPSAELPAETCHLTPCDGFAGNRCGLGKPEREDLLLDRKGGSRWPGAWSDAGPGLAAGYRRRHLFTRERARSNDFFAWSEKLQFWGWNHLGHTSMSISGAMAVTLRM